MLRAIDLYINAVVQLLVYGLNRFHVSVHLARLVVFGLTLYLLVLTSHYVFAASHNVLLGIILTLIALMTFLLALRATASIFLAWLERSKNLKRLPKTNLSQKRYIQGVWKERPWLLLLTLSVVTVAHLTNETELYETHALLLFLLGTYLETCK